MKSNTKNAAQRPVICVKNASFRFGEDVVFRRTNWRICAGQQWAIVGPNGSGKSFLARALGGEVPTCGGDVLYDFPANGRSDGGERAPEDEVAIVSLDAQRDLVGRYSPYYQSRWNSAEGEDCPTVREALSRDHIEGVLPFQVVERGAADRDYKRRRRDAVRRLDIGHLLRRKILYLSNGEMRKVLMARAMVQAPSVLILDDPFLGLDNASRRLLRGVIADLMTQMQVLLVTSRRDEILGGISHILFVDRMRVVAQGTRQEMLKAPEAARFFRSRPSGRLVVSQPTDGVRADAAEDRRTLIRLQNATVAYGRAQVLRGIDWTVRSGEHWALLGPNGCGKTTLLSLITGDNPQAYSNEVSVFGRRRGSGESIWALKKRIGFMSPELLVHYQEELTCYEVICSGFFDSIGLYRRPSTAQRRRADAWLTQLGLADVRHEDFGRISDGRQRLALLARALVKAPKLLMLDEPAQGLDAENRRQILQAVNRVAETMSTTLVYVTHHFSEMPDCITHVLKLSRGRVVKRGTRKTVLGR